ncbi:putative beta-lysine N-acetyltransferase [Paenibacillus sp. P25]|nr:putative beta-lysine N-acetyltransferase [Paenibacillus sp. P25]
MPKEQPYYTLLVENGEDFKVYYCLDRFNKRLRVDDYEGDAGSVCARMLEIAKANALTKLFIKTREEDWQSLLSRGRMLEGIYKGYYHGARDAYCMAYYLDLERRTSEYWTREDRILEEALKLAVKADPLDLPEDFTPRVAGPRDAGRLAALYAEVFQTYPTPMNDPSYVAKVMEEGTLFYLIEQTPDLLISAASAEINDHYRNAEMTDCATLPAYRGRGLMRVLLQALENELAGRKIASVYSLARALSFGMNACFRRLGYGYYGRLTKNCDIYDKFEDMNLWAKTLPGKL